MAERTVSRREFLKLAGIAGTTVAVSGGLGLFLEGCGGHNRPETTVRDLKKAEGNIEGTFDIKLNQAIVETTKILPHVALYKIYDQDSTNTDSDYYYGVDPEYFYYFKGDGYKINDTGVPGYRQEGSLEGTLTDATDLPKYEGLELSERFIIITKFQKKQQSTSD